VRDSEDVHEGDAQAANVWSNIIERHNLLFGNFDAIHNLLH
jgi:hypothetical protein